MRHEAIMSVHPEVVTVNGDEWGKLQAWDANGADIAINQSAVDAETVVLIAAHAVEVSAKANRLASVKSKLEALGLTTEEVKEAFGI